ncbi:hypothetical protein Pjdr2_0670 [Paenibacillus sp. JDR-2]|nr:hypothetical protein Pjdr2_0670 [Paenibacillus sp. JDR-2]
MNKAGILTNAYMISIRPIVRAKCLTINELFRAQTCH